MNFYALNATPISGWATHLGAGDAQFEMTATGRIGRVAIGNGKAELALTAKGTGIVKMLGRSAAAKMVLEAIGDGVAIPLLGGTASMRLVARGDGTITQTSASQAVMRMLGAMSWQNPIARRAVGVAELVMTAESGIPTPHTIRGNASDAHSSRVLIVPRDTRGMRVPRDNRSAGGGK